jgi:hypothetical protein
VARALHDPSSVYAAPMQVVDDDALALAELERRVTVH